MGQYDDAIRLYQQAINLNRRQTLPSPWPPLNLGALLVRLGKYQEAEACLQESLRYDFRFPKAHYQMGLRLEKEKKGEEAIRELNLAVQYAASYSDPHYSWEGFNGGSATRPTPTPNGKPSKTSKTRTGTNGPTEEPEGAS